MKTNKGVQGIILLSTLAVLFIFLLDLRNDYYYHFTKKETVATIRELKRVEENKPYLITINYFNEYTNKESECTLKLNSRFGKKINELSTKTLSIVYTKNASCDFYIIDYKHPNIGSFIIHAFIFLIALIGVILCTKNLLSKSPVERKVSK